MERKYEMQVQEEEISLVDLCVILYKHKLFIIVTTLLISLASLGGAFYLRANKQKVTTINFNLNNKLDRFYLRKANLSLVDLNVGNLLKNDGIVEKLFLVKEVKEKFINSGRENTIDEKREFLEKVITLVPVEGDVEVTLNEKTEIKKGILYYELDVKGLTEAGAKEVIDTYIDSANIQYKEKYINEIDSQYNKVVLQKKEYEQELKEINASVQKILKNESDVISSSQNAMEFLALKYPREFENQKQVEELYTKYNEELIGLNGIKSSPKLGNRIQKSSSFYTKKEKSKAILVLAGGIVLGFILGVLGAFALEFWNVLKVEIKKN